MFKKSSISVNCSDKKVTTVFLSSKQNRLNYGKIEGIEKSSFHERKQDEVTHVANLSKLKFSPEETAEFATTLSKIVDMVELLEEVDTTGVAPTTTMADRKTVLRPDVAEKGTDRDRLFKNVPEKDNYYIKVPAILEDGGDA